MMIISALPSLLQMGTGIGQQIQAGNLRKQLLEQDKNRPTYQTPEEAMNALQLVAQGFADPRMSGQGRLEDLSGLNLSQVVQAGVEGGNPFAMLSSGQGRADLTQQEIQARAGSMQEQERLNLAQAFNTMAGFKDQEWQMNEYAPWRDKYQFLLNEYRDKLTGGGQNTMAGASGLSSSALAGGMMNGGGGVNVDMLMKIFQSMSGGGSMSSGAGFSGAAAAVGG